VILCSVYCSNITYICIMHNVVIYSKCYKVKFHKHENILSLEEQIENTFHIKCLTFGSFFQDIVVLGTFVRPGAWRVPFYYDTWISVYAEHINNDKFCSTQFSEAPKHYIECGRKNKPINLCSIGKLYTIYTIVS